jgi:hypothetical protein
MWPPAKNNLALAGVLGSLITACPALADDYVTPLDLKTGKVLVLPEDSALAEDATTGHPSRHPPPYTLLRYTERYSYLAEPGYARDGLDSLKYIPLTPGNPESYLSLGGEVRERYESYHNQGFGVSGPKQNDYGLQRLLLHADMHFNERLRVFAQGISSVQFGGEFKSPINQNPLDLQQAFVDYTWGEPTPNGERLTLRGGRFSMAYGSSRLVATRAAPNTPLKFDGVQLIASAGGKTKLYAFAVRPVEEQRYRPDAANEEQAFYGVYASRPLTPELSADLYYLGFRDEKSAYVDASGLENRHSIGSRWFGKSGNWDYDIEPVYQFGHVDNQDIRAWTLANDIGYTFLQHPWQPRLGLKLDIASGDRHQGDGTVGTFNPLFFKAGYFNDASLLRPANIKDLHVSLQTQPLENLTATVGADAIWRFSKEDAVYATNGAVSLPANVQGMYVGTTAEGSLQWKASRHMVATLSYVHLYASSYVKNAGGGDVDYVATWLSFLW